MHIYEYSIIFFPVVFGSILSLLVVQPLVPCPPNRAPIPDVGIKLDQSLVGHSYKFFTTNSPTYLVVRINCKLKVLWFGGVLVSLLEALLLIEDGLFGFSIPHCW